MMTAKRKPRVGDEAWAVDWCANIPVDEYGDSDMDNADERCERFPTRDEAMARAREVLPLDAFGSVLVTPVRFVAYDEADELRYPHVGFWEACGESECVDE